MSRRRGLQLAPALAPAADALGRRATVAMAAGGCATGLLAAVLLTLLGG